MTSVPPVFRHESFLLTLPFDAGLQHGFILHVKDDAEARRSPGWEAFDLQRYLGLDSPEAPGDLASTTLMFARVPGPPVRAWRDVEMGWPRIFKWQRRQQHPWYTRWRYWPALQRARDIARPPRDLRTSRSVVQAVRLAHAQENPDELWRFAQLDRALEHLNDFLTAVMSVRRDAELTIVGRRDFPPLVFGFGWDVRADGTRSDVEWQGYLTHDRVGIAGRPLSKPEADLATWISASRDHPLKRAGDFLLSANATYYRGRYSHAVADAGTAVEMLVSASLRLAGPLRGYDATRLGNVLDGPFASRVKDHFAPMFGYDRDPLSASDALGVWWRRTYLLRNRVVHRGYHPTEDEAAEALDAAEGLHHDLGAKLSASPDLKALLIPIPEEVIRAADEAAEDRGEPGIED